MVLLFVLLLAGTASALPDDSQFVIRDPPPMLEGERIPVFLVLDEQPSQFTSFSQLKADALSRQAQVLQTVRAVDSAAIKTARSYWIANAVWLEADPTTLDRLAAIPGVSHIEPDLTIMLNDPIVEISSTIDPESIQHPESEYAAIWSADFIEAPSVWKSGNAGEGVTIAIVDTGIDGNHPAFGGRVMKFADFVNGDNETPYDDDGHGTHCAGTAAGGMVTVKTSYGKLDVTLGIAPGANLIGAKVLDGDGSGSLSTVLDGAQWAIENGADIISMSIGSCVSRSEFKNDIDLSERESCNVTLEVSSEMYGDTNCLYEPQFVIGSVQVDSWYHYTDSNPLENLTITLTDAQGNVASGAEIDWLGFDQVDSCFYFKAPYDPNAGAWNGVWKLSVTNTGATEVQISEIRLSEYYHSNGETVFDTAANNIVSGGTVVALAAGNEGWYGTSTITLPGTAKDVITVGATDYLMDYRASFSSMGPVNRADPYIKPDVMAPGVGIISAYPEGWYASASGTSMACPAVAGTAALMLSGNSSLTPADVKAALMETAVHIDEDGTILPVVQPNNAYGAGRVNAYEAVNMTGGLGGTRPSDGVLRELIGGTLASSSETGDILPVMAVLWNTTAGEPMAGEDVDVSVWYNSGQYPYQSIYIINQTFMTDENGYICCEADIADVPDYTGIYYQIVYDDLRIEKFTSKLPAPSIPSPESADPPIFEGEYYSVPHNATVPIKYPLLAADGSPYTESVKFTIGNRSTDFINETLVPVDGVVSYSFDLAGMPLDETTFYLKINDRSAGSVDVDWAMPPLYQEIIPLPSRAICLPGESVDLGIMAWAHHEEKTTSQEFDVYITSLTETEVLSLSAAGARALSAPDQGDMQGLLAEIAGMKPETRMGTVNLVNGIGILNFTMPKNGYIAVVRFVSPYDIMPMSQAYDEATTILVYGTLEPWLMHRSTPPAYYDFDYGGDLTYIDSTYDWPAIWDRDAYVSIPADEATITAHVSTYRSVMGMGGFVSGQTVYLYTENGVETNVTDATGCCTFTVDTAGKTRMEYLLTTAGISDYIYVWDRNPLDQIAGDYVRPGMITNRPATPTSTGILYPDSETRSADVVLDGDAYNVIARSYGPAGEPIYERGTFTLNRQSLESIWYSEATEAAAVVEFTGTETRRVTPAAEGDYEVKYGLLNPNSKSIDRYLFTTFRNPEQSVSYTMPGSVLVGTSVPVVFTALTSDGTPIAGARVALAAGAAGDWDWLSDSFSQYNDLRDANILLASDWFPDPYTMIATGYTDASGKVTLMLTTPTTGQQALREALIYESDIPYMVLCYHNGGLVQEDYGYLGLTSKLLPDFVPDVSAPHIVKLERDDRITIPGVTLFISNIGTADYVYDGINDISCTVGVGSFSDSIGFTEDLAIGERKDAFAANVNAEAGDFGINTSDYQLPLDVSVAVEVNSNRVVEELDYTNNRLAYPVRITAPDLAVEIIAPRYTTPLRETAIGIRVTNLGEVGSNATSLLYSTTGERDTTFNVPALGANESVMFWKNRTFTSTGDYRINAEVNRGGLTDYETTFANNRASATIGSYEHPASRIELPQDLVLVPGTVYNLSIIASDISDLAAYQIDLTFNGSVLEVEDIIPGPLGITARNIMDGSVSFNGAAVSGVSGDVTIGTIQFSVVGMTGDETALDLIAGLWDVNTLPIPVEVVNGSAYLLLYGDANGDGVVNQADTLKVLRLVVGLDTAKPTAGTPAFLVTDVTRNRAIDVGDAMFIAQYSLDPPLRDAYFRLK